MRPRLLVHAFLLVGVLAGCAGPVVTLPDPTDQDLNVARIVLKRTPLSPAPAPMDFATQLEASNPTVIRVQNAAIAVCRRFQLNRCENPAKQSVLIVNDPETINASADQHHQVRVYTGLINHLGVKDELAGVLAHEYAHIMMGHVGKKQTNMLTGGLLTMGLVGVLAASQGIDLNPSAYQSAGDLGALVGSRAYSPEMELEADRIAVHILKEAGYPLRSMRDALIRLSRTQTDAESSGTALRVGFLETHPSDDRRIAHVLQAIQDAEAGLPWNKTLIRQE